MNLTSHSVIALIRTHLTGKCNQESLDHLVNILECTNIKDVYSFFNTADNTVESFAFGSFDYIKYVKKNDTFLFYRNRLEYKPYEQIFNLFGNINAQYTVLDKIYFVNMDNVCSFNSYLQTINFFGVESKGEDDPRFTQASMKKIIVRKGKEFDLHKESDKIYSPLIHRKNLA